MEDVFSLLLLNPVKANFTGLGISLVAIWSFKCNAIALSNIDKNDFLVHSGMAITWLSLHVPQLDCIWWWALILCKFVTKAWQIPWVVYKYLCRMHLFILWKTIFYNLWSKYSNKNNIFDVNMWNTLVWNAVCSITLLCIYVPKIWWFLIWFSCVQRV